MPETTDIPHRSVHDGRAHKCGHDGHTAIMLGVAAMLGRVRDRIAGNVRLVFQPAEEGVDGGGGKRMVAEGAMVGVDEVYGLHNWPPLPRGTVAVRPGPVTAQTHWLSLTVHGKGGHASMPEVCRDPIVAASQIVVALQSVVSRGLGYDGGAVVTIGRFTAGTTDNVIPDFAELEGTVRTFHPDVTQRVLERIREIVSGTAAAFGVRAELQLEPGYPSVINAAPCADAVRRVAQAVVGEAATTSDGLPIAGGEDFAYLAQAVPGAFFFVGTGDGESTPGCHHPDFDFDDRIIPIGVEMFLGLVDDRVGTV
jgi:amidohydrolase